MRIPTLPITTERLLLRRFLADDLDALHAILSRPDVNRYLFTEAHTRHESHEALQRRMGRDGTLAEDGDSLALAVVLRDTGELIGDGLLLLVSERSRRGEIGFIFHPDHYGHGYASELARELLRIGFQTYGLHRLIGRCDARNSASADLMRRLGMRLEAHLRQNEFVKGEWLDEQVYALLTEEWRALTPSVREYPATSPST
ncbi:MAG: GNAT family N-acetyltransferase [Micromonosporaceae bacterium]